MKTNNNIENKIKDALNSVDVIADVNVSPYFKDKTMQRMFAEKVEKQTSLWLWFTPQLQLVTLVCFFALNIYAFTQINSTSYSDNISDFAETHGLSISEDNSLFN